MFHYRFKQLLDAYKELHPQTSHAKIAKTLGISPQAFSYYLNGREPNYEILVRIANFFEVTVDYLLGNEEFATKLQKKHTEELGISKHAALSLSSLQDFDASSKEQGFEKPYNITNSLNILLTHNEGHQFFTALNRFLNIKRSREIEDFLAYSWKNTNLDVNFNIESSLLNIENVYLVELQKALLDLREELVREYQKEINGEAEPPIEELVAQLEEIDRSYIENELKD